MRKLSIVAPADISNSDRSIIRERGSVQINNFLKIRTLFSAIDYNITNTLLNDYLKQYKIKIQTDVYNTYEEDEIEDEEPPESIFQLNTPSIKHKIKKEYIQYLTDYIQKDKEMIINRMKKDEEERALEKKEEYQRKFSVEKFV